ncbi:E3 ubiquitin-protein ligase TRIM71-like [Oopsacas minuta]|uniref:E3 ubiquitin-protein ligase TRIM71-like n=1 Tax=Oopsacas minuta TaxID=111878 RepID=A0AAV7K1R2_9METZ|nr:E3 ubiquitin-protein ligase TRIM71-like [Oopsacas minuta]
MTTRNHSIQERIKKAKREVSVQFEELIVTLQKRRDELLDRLDELEREQFGVEEKKREIISQLQSMQQYTNQQMRAREVSSLKQMFLESIDAQIKEIRDQEIVPQFTDIQFCLDESIQLQLSNIGSIVLEGHTIQPRQILPAKEAISDKFLPLSIDTDEEGNIFILSLQYKKEIVSLRPDGTVINTLPMKCSGKMQLGGIAVSNKYVFVTLSSEHTLHVYEKNRSFLKCLGKRGDDKGEFQYPFGVAARDDILLVCERDNNRVQVFKSLVFSHFIGYENKTPGQLRKPINISINKKFDAVVLHRGHPCINVYSLFGQLLYQLGCQIPRSELDGLGWDVCITEEDDIFITDFQSHNLLIFQGDRTTCVKYGSKGRDVGQFMRPEGITINGELLLVCDQDNNRIQCFPVKELMTNY